MPIDWLTTIPNIIKGRTKWQDGSVPLANEGKVNSIFVRPTFVSNLDAGARQRNKASVHFERNTGDAAPGPGWQANFDNAKHRRGMAGHALGQTTSAGSPTSSSEALFGSSESE